MTPTHEALRALERHKIPAFAANYPAVAQTLEQSRLLFYCCNCYRKAETRFITPNVGPFCDDCIEELAAALLREAEGTPPVPIPEAHARAAERFNRLATPVPLTDAERLPVAEGTPPPQADIESLLTEWDEEVAEHGLWTSGHSIAARIVAKLRSAPAPTPDARPEGTTECPYCGGHNTYDIYRPEVYEFPHACRDCDRGF